MTSVFTATVKGGVIVADDVELPEGATVTVVLEEPADAYDELTPAETAEVQEAIGEADRGEGVPWATVSDELRRDRT